LRLNTLVAGILAYTLSLFLPVIIYMSLSFQPAYDIIFDIIVIVIVGAAVGLGSALITQNQVEAVLTSIIGGILGLLTPYLSYNILQVNLPSILLKTLERPLGYFMIILSPAIASVISLAYLSIVKPKPPTTGETEEPRKEIIEERKEELVSEEKEVIEEIVREEAVGEAIEEEVGVEVKPTEVPKVVHEPELDIIKELVEEIEQETKIKKEADLEEAPVTEEGAREELLKKCKHCGEMIPYDSFYCPLCGEYQGEE